VSAPDRTAGSSALARQGGGLALAAPGEGLHGHRTGAHVADALDITVLYRRYGDLVLGRCRTLLRNDADAQDALQEVFLKLHRYRDGFRGEASPSTWLFKITTTTCLNRIRTRRRRPEDPVEELPPMESTDSLLDTLAMRDLIGRLLDGQDERTQSCVVFHYVDGMTHDEIGELLGVSGAAVRKRISTFRTSLRESPPPWLAEIEP
jgi:RNA polymerase sigma-70 factor (ECF subfamily)